MENYFRKKRQLEDKALTEKKVLKKAREQETQKIMEQTNRLFLKTNHKKLML